MALSKKKNCISKKTNTPFGSEKILGKSKLSCLVYHGKDEGKSNKTKNIWKFVHFQLLSIYKRLKEDKKI